MSDGVGRGARIAQRALLLTARPPFLGAWRAVYRLLARISAAVFARGTTCSVYLRGSLQSADFVPALSDVDVVLVFDPAVDATAARQLVRGRWESLRRRSPATASLLDRPLSLGADELRELAGGSVYTAGRVGAMDTLRLLERPRLGSTTAGWTRVAGPELRPAEPVRDDQQERVAAWLEITWNWTLAIQAIAGAPQPHTARLCVKLVAEPARALAWLTRRERLETQRMALDAACAFLPGHEQAIARVLRAHDDARRLPAPPLDEAVAVLAALTDLVAAEIERQLEPAPRTHVTLVGRGDGRALPLCDWRALVQPGLPELSFVAVDGMGSAAALEASLTVEPPAPVAARVGGGTIVFPARSREVLELRAAGCRPTDPVSLALVDGLDEAAFVDVAGWSAADWTRHAVTAHAAVLGGGRPSVAGSLAAARAALFHASLGTAQARLPLTLDATLGELRAEGVLDGAAARAAAEALRLEREGVADELAGRALRDAVSRLPALAG